MTRPSAQNSPVARILVLGGLAVWLVSLFFHEVWVIVAAAGFTLAGAIVYGYHLRQPGDVRRQARQ